MFREIPWRLLEKAIILPGTFWKSKLWSRFPGASWKNNFFSQEPSGKSYQLLDISKSSRENLVPFLPWRCRGGTKKCTSAGKSRVVRQPFQLCILLVSWFAVASPRRRKPGAQKGSAIPPGSGSCSNRFAVHEIKMDIGVRFADVGRLESAQAVRAVRRSAGPLTVL